MENKKESSGLIRSTEIMQSPPKSNGFLELLGRLNPFGAIGSVLSQVLDYKREIKYFELDILRIEEEAKLRNKQLDMAFQIEITKIEERRKVLQDGFAVIAKMLDNIHMQKLEITSVISDLSESLSSTDLALEEKRIIRETIGDLSKLSISVGQEGTACMNILAQNTQKALESLPSSRELLALGREG